MSLVLFYFGWWACAIGAIKGIPWLGPALIPVAVGLHLLLSPLRAGEIRFVILLAFAGTLIDTVLINLHLFTITSGERFAPQWLLAMWVLLGITYESMLGMRRNPWLLRIVGGLTGPLTYVWCEGVDLLEYGRPVWLTISIHGLLWAGLTPTIFQLRDLCMDHALGHRFTAPALSEAELALELERAADPVLVVEELPEVVPSALAEPPDHHTNSSPPI
jgi:hypothetical protein